jgi:(E)-4-hydroxy-3-methylbut-2-enyl-diphosphate synthase
VRYLVDVARAHGCAMRIGVNAGSVDPEKLAQYSKDDSISPMIDSALEHCAMLDDLGFDQYCVSLKDSDPNKVIDANIRFAEARPDVPLHLGVTEAGMPPDGIIKTRVAFEQLITRGIGDTIRVSLTLPFENKGDEVTVGRQILDDIATAASAPCRASSRRAEHHQLPVVLARRERGLHRSRAEREAR